MTEKQESNQYDKVIKENLSAVVPSLIQKVLGLQPIQVEKLKDILPRTLEREPDDLLKITDSQHETFILHLEFQTADDAEMIYRMLEYFGILFRKYKISVRQYVFYLGEKGSKMETRLEKENISFQFSLIQINQIDYRLFLTSEKPEEIIFALLANFGETPSQQATEQIINRIYETSAGELAFQKYTKQLRILAKLRKFDLSNDKIMDSILKFIDEENDILFQKGEKKGMEKGMEKLSKKMIVNLLQQTEFTTEKIAQLVGVSTDFVEKIKKTLI